jgi:hypothetical protein
MENRGLKHSSRSLSLVLSLIAGLAGLAAASAPAGAELVILTDGSVFKVKGYEQDGEQASLSFHHGGRMSLALARIERVVDDEVEMPEPDPVPVPEEMAAVTPPPAPINLRFQEGQKIPPGKYGELIYAMARRHDVNPEVVAALIRAESAFNPRAVSHKGARGLMQLMPATAQRFGVAKHQLFQPEHNLEAGMRYLSWLVGQFPNDLSLVLAAYNAGEGSVARYQGVPPYKETRNYIRRIFGTLGLTVAEL